MENDELTTSEEYEERALEALDKGDTKVAGVYAQLALTATLRESAFILAEILEEDDGAEDDAEAEDEAA